MKDFNKLSDRQRNMLRYIETYIVDHGYPPTIRQIGENTGINSTSVVNYNLNKLVQAGYLTRSQHVSRGLRLTVPVPGNEKKGSKKAVQVTQARPSVPVIGHIFASEPTPAPEDYHYDEDDLIEVTSDMLSGTDPADAYALKVKGDSMMDAMIREGDIVIFRRQETAKNGDMVAVWLTDRSETTLKYFYKEGDRVRLQPAHPQMDAIYVDPRNCRIEGKVLSVIRHL
ncbi:MAG: transcriptional repressor LexA [Anaerolineae bacterium]|nr:transcriptional repressor LexA [Anaerolineae bacterium]